MAQKSSSLFPSKRLNPFRRHQRRGLTQTNQVSGDVQLGALAKINLQMCIYHVLGTIGHWLMCVQVWGSEKNHCEGHKGGYWDLSNLWAAFCCVCHQQVVFCTCAWIQNVNYRMGQLTNFPGTLHCDFIIIMFRGKAVGKDAEEKRNEVDFTVVFTQWRDGTRLTEWETMNAEAAPVINREAWRRRESEMSVKEGESCIISERSLISCFLNSAAAPRSSSWTDFTIDFWRDNQTEAAVINWELGPGKKNKNNRKKKNLACDYFVKLISATSRVETLRCLATQALGTPEHTKQFILLIAAEYRLRPVSFPEKHSFRDSTYDVTHRKWIKLNNSEGEKCFLSCFYLSVVVIHQLHKSP